MGRFPFLLLGGREEEERGGMTKIQVQGGTPDASLPSLCHSCRYGHVMRNAHGSEYVRCNILDEATAWISTKIIECTDYNDKRVPTEYTYRETAWILEGSNKKNPTFKPPKVY